MQASIVTNLLLPLALGIIMLGLGLSLTVADVRRIVRSPRAVLIGLFTQTVIVVAGAFVIAKLFALSPELAVGLMLLAASPGGASANTCSHLAHGDVALNITLTAVDSALALLTLPLIVLPVVLGMSARALWPRFAASLERPIRVFAVLILAAVVLAAVAAEWQRLPGFIAAVGAVCLAFNLPSMAAGYGLPRLLRLPRDQSIAISMEIGIHNGTLAIFIALHVLGNATISIPAAGYSIIAFVTAGVFTWWLNRRR
jgi:BASS family bile acid:Na+ symporter